MALVALPPALTNSHALLVEPATRNSVDALDDVSPIAEALPPQRFSIPPPLPTLEDQVERILSILAGYRMNTAQRKTHDWVGKGKVALQLQQCLEGNCVIRLALPAFPFKSPNKLSKVLGPLPDEAERVALQHLNGLCLMIGEIHAPGAELFIVSDGMVYNDLLGVEDREVWRYGEALRKMATANNCNQIKFVRLNDLLDIELSAALTEESYVDLASQHRQKLVDSHTPINFDVDKFLNDNADATLTYRGYIKFLEKDLEHDVVLSASKNRRKELENIAKKMITRGKAFAAAIERKFSSHVRLSIHCSQADANKLSVSLIPQRSTCSMTPWHACLVRAVDGSITMSHSLRVPAVTHELISENGRPSYFREKSDLFDWPEMNVTFEYLYPTGILIKPASPNTSYSLHNVHMQKVRGLAEKCSPIILRGFKDTTDERVFKAKAYDAGEVQPWFWGVMQRVKDSMNSDGKSNNVVSSEAMPMHYDGLYKYVTETDAAGNETRVQKAPRFQMFTAVTPSPPGTGYTLFANSRLFFQHLPPGYKLEDFSPITWSVKQYGFFANHLKGLPLVVPHPTTAEPCLRWHEPWPAWKTSFAPAVVRLENAEQSYCSLIDSMLYDRRVCLYFSWDQGDVVVSDNISMLHTRTAFNSECDRELWRIHFD